MPSLFNHSCVGSATWCNFRDVMVIRATKNMARGEEVTIPYTQGATYLCRRKELDKHMSACNCSACEKDRVDGDTNCKSRQVYLRRASVKTMLEQTKSISYARALAEAMQQTYPSAQNSFDFGPAYTMALHPLMEILTRQQPREIDWFAVAITGHKAMMAARFNVNFHNSDGFDDTLPVSEYPIDLDNLPTGLTSPDVCIVLCLQTANAFNIMRDVRLKRWLRAARWCTSYICY